MNHTILTSVRHNISIGILIVLVFTSEILSAQTLERGWSLEHRDKESRYPGPLIVCKQGGCAFVSQSSGFNERKQTDLIRLNDKGEVMWTKSFPDETHQELYSLVEAPDGSFFISGHHNVKGFDNKDVFIAKTDASGNFLWLKTFGGYGYELEGGLIITNDGQLALGATATVNENYYDFWLVKLDLNGNKLWEKFYSFSNDDRVEDIAQLKDNSFLLLGTVNSKDNTNTDDTDFGLIKTDANGNEIWRNRYSGILTREFAKKMLVLENENKILLAGKNRNLSEKKYDALLIYVDLNGKELAYKHIGEFDISDGIEDIGYDSEKIWFAGVKDMDEYYLWVGVMDKELNLLQEEITREPYEISDPDLCIMPDKSVVVAAKGKYGEEGISYPWLVQWKLVQEK